MNYLIRDCKPADLEQLVDLCEKHAAFERAEYCRVGKAERLRQAIFSDNRILRCRVVEAAGSLVGYYSYTFDYSTWDASVFINMDCLYLDPEYRGAGIGSKIMEELKQLASKRNCSAIQWQTPTFNEGAIGFYKMMGAIGREKTRFTLHVAAHLPKE